MINYKIGQLFFTGISGHGLTDEESDFIQKEDIGGVILFAHNYTDSAQLAELCNQIQSLRGDHPLFIGVDQEGGRVQRFKKQFGIIPPMLSLSALGSPKIVFEIHQLMATQLMTCGVNVDFSPVCDIFTNQNNKVIGDRAFGRSEEVVSKMISAAIRGLHTGGILSCAKHFPGHGNTTKDSHISLPILKTSKELLVERELIPFVKASKARVSFMMMAHLVVDCIDSEYPTSLSQKAYKLLREETRFRGIIITDDMEMGAITENFGLAESAVMALNAGADQLIFRSFEKCREALEATKNAINEKNISRKAISDKIDRIKELKKEKLSNFSPIYIPSISKVFGNKENDQLLKSISDQLEAK